MSPSVFDPRLEYTTVAKTALSDIDGETGDLIIGGFPVEELAANATFEESVFLLFDDRLPTADELETFRSDLASRRRIGDDVRSVVRRAAAEGRSAMDALRMGIAAADLEYAGRESTPDRGADDGLGASGTDARTADNRHPTQRAAAKRVVAVAPTIAAAYWRYRRGLDPVAPDADLGHAANYLYMLTGAEPAEAEIRGLETFLTAIVDHGLNPSTFTARTVVSTESDIVSAVTAAVGALKGPRHGGNLASIFETLQTVHESGDPEGYVREALAADEELQGFGHRIYHVRDPRAAVLSAAAERFYAAAETNGFLDSVREYESVATAIAADRESTGNVAATVEFYAAALLHGIGVPSALFTATFAVSRVGGWTAHCLEQLADNDLVRPTAQYVGASDQTWTPVENRYAAGNSLVGQSARSTAIEPVSETLALLSEPARLELLLVLSDSDAPVAYSTLRAASSIDDKGRFNYHLRQLRDYFVANRADGYELTDAGRTVVRTVLTDELLAEVAARD